MSKTLQQILQERDEYRSIIALTDEVLHYIERMAKGEVEVPLPDNVFEQADVSLIEPIKDVVLEFRLEAVENLATLNDSKVVPNG